MWIKRMVKGLSLFLLLTMGLAFLACRRVAPLEQVKAVGDEIVTTDRVVLYSSMQEEQLMALKSAFEKKHPLVTMEYYFAGTSKVITKLGAEAQSGQVLADVIWLGDPSDYFLLKEQNILQKYTSPEAEAIQAVYIDPEGYYTGARLMNMVIAYNTDLVTPEEAPQSWTDLLHPNWYNEIVLTDPGNSGTSKYWRNAMMSSEKYGVEYIQNLKNNGCNLESNSASTHGQLASGRYKVGIGLDYIVANLAHQGGHIGFVYPKDTISIFSPIGLIKDCRNETNGRLLYDFILSKEGQQLLVDNNLISVRNDIPQDDIQLEKIVEKLMESDMEKIAANEEMNGVLFDKMFGL